MATFWSSYAANQLIGDHIRRLSWHETVVSVDRFALILQDLLLRGGDLLLGLPEKVVCVLGGLLLLVAVRRASQQRSH